MLEIIVRLLSRPLSLVGVLPRDIESYLDESFGQVRVLLLAGLMALVVLATQGLIRKGAGRRLLRALAVVVLVMAVLAPVSMVAIGSVRAAAVNQLAVPGSVSRHSASASLGTVADIGDEGIVLLENDDHLLPLPASTKHVNVFGWASTNPVIGGTGSGAVEIDKTVGVYQALQEAGYSTNSSLEQMYRSYQQSRSLGEAGQMHVETNLPEPPASYYTAELLAGARSFSDVALVVLSRMGGESQDLPTDMAAVSDGSHAAEAEKPTPGNEQLSSHEAQYVNNGDYDDFAVGEHYLQLSQTEKDMLSVVDENFSNVIVLINSSNPMELGWLDGYSSIKSVLLTPGTGVNAMTALGRILNGSVNPSGRTVDTFVNDLRQTPAYNNFGGFEYTNVDDLASQYLAADPSFAGVLGRVSYNEGIYVGYRFYETAAVEGLISYESQVRYPFGFGLSYTDFKQKITSFDASSETVKLTVEVTNSGNVAGKDVVELYSTPPYTNGGIEKSAVNLVDFAKTDTLSPGESAEIRFAVPKEDLASYDSSRIKTSHGGYVLEAGQYTLSVRSDSHTVLDSRAFTVDEDIDYSVTGRDSDKAPATNRFEDYTAGGVNYLSRADHFANYQQATAAPSPADLEMSPEVRQAVDSHSVANYDPEAHIDPQAVMPTTGASGDLLLSDMTGLDYDDPRWENLLDQLSVQEMSQLVSTGGFSTAAISSVGKPQTYDSDGPAGLHDVLLKVHGTPFPAEVLIAQTWNKELALEAGERIGQEYAEANIYGWYGPGMNTHRTAFGGRNFEYYSEDGVLAGKMASATVNGAARKGVYSYIKHFALNDQETNRCSLLQTYATEQSMREIYLRPFELVVKGYEDGAPQAVMSSYNFIGTRYAGADPNLLGGVLRQEWGFEGMVLSDWYGSYGYQQTTDSVLNGNDMMLGLGPQARSEVELQDSPTVVTALRAASKNILFTIANSGNYTNKVGQSANNLRRALLAVDAVAALICLAYLYLALRGWHRERVTARPEPAGAVSTTPDRLQVEI